MLDVKQHLRRVRIDQPEILPADPVAQLPKPHPRCIDEAKRVTAPDIPNPKSLITPDCIRPQK